MRRLLTISEVKENAGRQLCFVEENDIKTGRLQATGQMLVDSDEQSFIYIVEDDEGFVYLRFPEATWTTLKEVLEMKKMISVHIHGQEIELDEFANELSYLIENIEGNVNYGEEMVSKVEKTFVDK